MPTKLLESVVGSLVSIRFFNGRLLTGTDLTKEQQSVYARDQRVAVALGSGVITGLEVSIDASSTSALPAVKITLGSGINRPGEVLSLSQDTVVTLEVAASAGTTPVRSDWRRCAEVVDVSVKKPNLGLYLLTMRPAPVDSVELARVLQADRSNDPCMVSYVQEGVSFRLIRLSNLEAALTTAGVTDARMQNEVAHACFGTATVPADPRSDASDLDRAIEALRLTPDVAMECDLPLAIVRLKNGIVWLDNWAARRRPTAPRSHTTLERATGPRSVAEAEARLLQFRDQSDSLPAPAATGTLTGHAPDTFHWIPPAGVLPLSWAASNSWRAFFGTWASPATAISCDAQSLPTLLENAALGAAVSMDGWSSWAPAIDVYAGQGTSGTAALVYTVSKAARLLVEHSVSGAKTLTPRLTSADGLRKWDLISVGTNTWVSPDLEPGTYSLTVESEFYQQSAQTLTLVGGRVGRATVSLVAKVPVPPPAPACELVASPGEGWQIIFDQVNGKDANICLPIGDFIVRDAPLVLKGTGRLLIHGGGPGSRLLGIGTERVLQFEGWSEVHLENLAAETPGAPASGGGTGAPLTFKNCGIVRVDTVQTRCGWRSKRGQGCMVVQNSADQDRQVYIQNCDFHVGHLQEGVLLINPGMVHFENNRMDADLTTIVMSNITVLLPELYLAVIKKTPVSAKAKAEPTAEFDPNLGLPKDGNPEVMMTAQSYTWEPQPVLSQTWDQAMSANPIPESNPEVLVAYQKDLARKILTDPIYFRNADVAKLVSGLRSSFQSIAAQGLVVVGRINEVRVLHNSFFHLMDAIRIVPTRPSGDPTARVVVVDNRVDAVMQTGIDGQHVGVYVGSAASICVENNRLSLSRPTDAATSAGIRLHGRIGAFVRVCGNHLSGYHRVLEMQQQASTPTSHLWLLAENYGNGATVVLHMPGGPTSRFKMRENYPDQATTS